MEDHDSRHTTQLTVPSCCSQSIVQVTVLVALQQGQLNAVSSFGAAALGGGLAELLRLPMGVWLGGLAG